MTQNYVMQSEPADEALMLAYQAGDAPSFDRLYSRHRGALFRFLLRGCSNRAQAEEMFQDVWMNVIKARGSYQVSAKFTTWLYRIAHNRLIDGYRQQRPQEELNEELPDEGAGPERAALRQEQLARLMRSISGLPLEQRTAFLLQEERGLTLEQIAEVTGVGRETVKSRLRYALHKLRGELDDV
jgi:RNA polymerase sigma-70 factor (ECF subfamily)